MSTNVSEGQTSYHNVPISDSGAKIPQHIKESDRNQKFKFFECLQALMQGRLPTNEQIDHFLAMAQNSPSLDAREHMLSADGRSLYQDFQELMRTTRGIVYEKNEQELFQNFIYHCTRATDTAPQNVQAPNFDLGVSSRAAKREGQETLDNLVVVAKLVTTNSDFRAILDELFQLAKEVLMEGADKLSQTAQMAGDRLAAKSNELSQNAAYMAQAGDVRLQNGAYRTNEAIQNIGGSASEDPVMTLQGTSGDAVEQANVGMTSARQQAANMKKSVAKQTEDLKGKAYSQAAETQQNLTAYASTKMPPERRNALIERLKVIVGQIQADPQYQATIDSIMRLFGTWRRRAQGPAGSVSAEAIKVVRDPNVEAAILEFKIILQRWAQGYSLDPMIAIIQNMWYKARTDPELGHYVDNVSSFMTRAIREPNYLASQSINSDASTLIDRGQILLNSKYKPDTDALFQEGQVFIEKLNNDPKSKEVAANFQQFANHLFYDSHGKLTFKPHLFDDFRYVLVPSLMESFQFIPIPRIEYTDLKVDLVLDNMILTSTDLLPRFLEVNMNNTLRMVPRGNAKRSLDANRHDFNVTIQGVEANIRDVDYYVKAKEGFRFKDRGIADVLIHKKGMDIFVKGRKTGEDVETPSMITVDDVKVKIHSLTINLRKSNHPVLYTFARPFIKTVVKNAIAHALEAQIRKALTSGDKTIATSIRDTRIKTGKNTFGALVDSATSFVSNKISPDEKTKARNERKKKQGHYNRTSRVIFDQDGLCVLDPVKHMELKIGQPLHEDPNAMAAMPVAAPWVSTAFDMKDMGIRGEHLPGMRRSQGTLAM
ncbi:hypothetical protein BGX28_009092 [Mortierella sp. GBA30]|nr:hypothetical protein BGX28_009092 [Mortierella sp. GBA30]